jgi:two-component system sensor histidine kinase KdpD
MASRRCQEITGGIKISSRPQTLQPASGRLGYHQGAMARGVRATGYAGALAAVGGATLLAALLHRHSESSDLTMVYLLAVVISAISFGRGPAIAAALLSVLVFNFMFVPPRFTLHVADTRYLVTFAVMFAVAVITGTLTALLREQRERALLRERRIASLHRLSHDLALRSTSNDVLEAAVARVGEMPGIKAAAALPDEAGGLVWVAGDPSVLGADGVRDAARRALLQGRIVSSPHGSAWADTLHLPLVAGTRVNGVLSLRATTPQTFADPERMEMIRAYSSLAALAIERCRLADDARRVQTQVESERARSALLSSVSHDLRTPLAGIMGAASTLRAASGEITDAARREMADTIFDQTERLDRLIGNLLEMTRVESGTLRVRKEWHSVEEVVGSSLTRLGPELADREVHVSLPSGLPLVPMDDVLFEQVVRNLIENAHKYSPPDGAITIDGFVEGEMLRLDVADRGEGLAAGESERVFEKFYRGARAATRPGAGLGLAICRGVVEAHGGTIVAANRSAGGSVFTVRLPLGGAPPVIEREQVVSESEVLP